MEYYFAEADADAIGTINDFLSDCIHSAAVSTDGKFVVVAAEAAKSKAVASGLGDLEGADIMLQKAEARKLQGATMDAVVEALTAAGHAARIAEVLGVNADGTVWTKTSEVGALVAQALSDKRKKDGADEGHAETPGDDFEPQSEEHMVHMLSTAPVPANITALPATWQPYMTEQVRTAKKGSNYGFTGRVVMELKGGCVSVVSYFKTKEGAENFAAVLRGEGKWTLLFDKDVKETKATVKFEWTDATLRVTLNKIDKIEDIVKGVAAGNATEVGHRVGGDAAILSGPTQAGKSTTISGLCGREMTVSVGPTGLKVVEGLNPLAAQGADEFGGRLQRMQNNYALVKRISGEPVDLPQDMVANRTDPLLRGVAVPDAYEFVPLGKLRDVPLKSGTKPDAEYETVPDEKWSTVPDVLAVAKENVGCSTTTDIYAYDVDGDFGFSKVLDTPGTHDTRGLMTDVCNTMVRLKALRQCSSIRLAVVVDFNQLSTAGGQKLPEFLAPVACMLRDFEKSLKETTVLLTRVTPALQMTVTNSEVYKGELISWLATAEAQVKNLVGGNGPVMQDKYAGPLLRHLVTELAITKAKLLGGSGPWGKATVVHPLYSPDAYLKGVMAAATPLQADAFRASLGPHGSAGLGRCLDLRLREFTHAHRQGDESAAVSLAANMYDALLQLEASEVHFTEEDAKLDHIEASMKNLLQDRRTVLIDALRAAIVGSDVEAVRAALSRLEGSQANIRKALSSTTKDICQRVSERLQIGDCATSVANQVRDVVAQALPIAEGYRDALHLVQTAPFSECRKALKSAQTLHAVSEVCHSGAQASITTLFAALRDAFEREAHHVHTAIQQQGLALDVSQCRHLLQRLDKGTQMAHEAGVTFGRDNQVQRKRAASTTERPRTEEGAREEAPLLRRDSSRTLKAQAAVADTAALRARFTHSCIDGVRSATLQQVLDAFIAVRTRISAGFSAEAKPTAANNATESIGAQLKAAASALKTICSVTEPFSELLRPYLPERTPDLNACLFEPLAAELQALGSSGLGTGVSASNPLELARVSVPLVEAKLRAIQVFAESPEKQKDVVDALGIAVAAVRDAAKASAKQALDEVEALLHDMTVPANSHVDPSTLSSELLTKESKAVHALACCDAMAEALVTRGGHAAELHAETRAAVEELWSAWQVSRRKCFDAARRVAKTTCRGFVFHRYVLSIAERCPPVDAVYKCAPSLELLRARHAQWHANLSAEIEALHQEVRDHVANMTVQDEDRLNYVAIAQWLSQLADLSPTSKGEGVGLPVEATREGGAKYDPVQEKRQHCVGLVKKRVDYLTRLANNDDGKTPFDVIFAAVLGEGLKIRDSEVLAWCQAANRDARYLDVTERLEALVDRVIDLTRLRRVDATAQVCTGVSNVLRTALTKDEEFKKRIQDGEKKIQEALAELTSELEKRRETFLAQITSEGESSTRSAALLKKNMRDIGEESACEIAEYLLEFLNESILKLQAGMKKFILTHSVDNKNLAEYRRASVMADVLDDHEAEMAKKRAKEQDEEPATANTPSDPGASPARTKTRKEQLLSAMETVVRNAIDRARARALAYDFTDAITVLIGIDLLGNELNVELAPMCVGLDEAKQAIMSGLQTEADTMLADIEKCQTVAAISSLTNRVTEHRTFMTKCCGQLQINGPNRPKQIEDLQARLVAKTELLEERESSSKDLTTGRKSLLQAVNTSLANLRKAKDEFRNAAVSWKPPLQPVLEANVAGWAKTIESAKGLSAKLVSPTALLSALAEALAENPALLSKPIASAIETADNAVAKRFEDCADLCVLNSATGAPRPSDCLEGVHAVLLVAKDLEALAGPVTQGTAHTRVEATCAEFGSVVSAIAAFLHRLGLAEEWASIDPISLTLHMEWLRAILRQKNVSAFGDSHSIPHQPESVIEAALQQNLVAQAKLNATAAEAILKAVSPLVNPVCLNAHKSALKHLKAAVEAERVALDRVDEKIAEFEVQPSAWQNGTTRMVITALYKAPAVEDTDCKAFHDTKRRDALRLRLVAAVKVAADRLKDAAAKPTDATVFNPAVFKATVLQLNAFAEEMGLSDFDFDTASKDASRAMHESITTLLRPEYLLAADGSADVSAVQLRSGIVRQIEIEGDATGPSLRKATAERLWSAHKGKLGNAAVHFTLSQIDIDHIDAAARSCVALGFETEQAAWNRDSFLEKIDAIIASVKEALSQPPKFASIPSLIAHCTDSSLMTLRVAAELGAFATGLGANVRIDEGTFDTAEELLKIRPLLPGIHNPSQAHTVHALTFTAFQQLQADTDDLRKKLEDRLIAKMGTAAPDIVWFPSATQVLFELDGAPVSVADKARDQIVQRVTASAHETADAFKTLAADLSVGLEATPAYSILHIAIALADLKSHGEKIAKASARFAIDLSDLTAAAKTLQKALDEVGPTKCAYLQPEAAVKAVTLLLPWAAQLRATELRAAGDQIIAAVAGGVVAQSKTIVTEWLNLKAGDSAKSTRLSRMYDALQQCVHELSRVFTDPQTGAEDPFLKDASDAHSGILKEIEAAVHRKLPKADELLGKDGAHIAKVLAGAYQNVHSCSFVKESSTSAFEALLTAVLGADAAVRGAVYKELKPFRSQGGQWLRERKVFQQEQRKERSVNDSIPADKAVNERMEFVPPLTFQKHLIDATHGIMTKKFLRLLQEAERAGSNPGAFEAQLPAKLATQSQEAAQDMSTDSLLNLLTLVCFGFTWLQSGQDYMDTKDVAVMKRPHAIQVASLLRLLQLDEPKKESTIANQLAKLAKAKASKDMFDGHMVEILTGQGKSITLGILACVLALLGRHVDVVCYSKQLTDRDAADMSALFALANVSDRVKYLTFQGVMDRRVGGLREAALSVIGMPAQAQRATVRDDCPERRVLLIDEVDVLFAPEFFGCFYYPTARYSTPRVTELLRFIYDNRTNPSAFANLADHPKVKAVADDVPELADFILTQLPKMCAQVRDIGAANNPPQGPVDYVADRDKGIGYYDTDGTINFRSAPHGWYRAAFALFKETDAGRVVGDRETRISLPLQLPGYSYSSLPSECYCAVFGVTGTLKTLSSSQSTSLQNMCNVKRRTYTLSAKDAPRAEVWNAQNCIMVPTGDDSEGEWMRAIERAINDVRRKNNVAANDTTKALPVVVVFEDRWRLLNFSKCAANGADYQIIDRDTPPDMVPRLVEAATEGYTVTLVDRMFGRGTDFKCKQCDKLTIIQTFIPETIAEEVQIRGRTARQGEPGDVVLVICPAHVTLMLAPPAGSDIEALSPEDVKAQWDASEINKVHPFQDLREAREAALTLERTTQLASRLEQREKANAFAAAMLDPSTPNRLELLVEHLPKRADNDAPYVFLIDASRSMICSAEELPKFARGLWGFFARVGRGLGAVSGRTRWPSVVKAFNTVIESIAAQNPETKVAVIVFGRKDETCVLHVGDVGDINESLLGDVEPDMNTEYYSAFHTALEAMRAKSELFDDKPTRIIFATDGEDEPSSKRNVDAAIRDLCQEFTIAEYFGLAIDMDAQAPGFKLLEQAFRGSNVSASTLAVEVVTEADDSADALTAALREATGTMY